MSELLHIAGHTPSLIEEQTIDVIGPANVWQQSFQIQLGIPSGPSDELILNEEIHTSIVILGIFAYN